MSLSSPLSILNVPCRLSPLIPKLIFLDLHMPLLDGFQTALAIRQLGFDMPIAALTASVGTADQRMAEQLGFQRYITKPISRPQLKEVLQLALKQVEPSVVAASQEPPESVEQKPPSVQPPEPKSTQKPQRQSASSSSSSGPAQPSQSQRPQQPTPVGDVSELSAVSAPPARTLPSADASSEPSASHHS